MQSAEGPFLIAITGGSGSGKTTLAQALASRIGPERCTLLTDDRYYKPRAEQDPSVVGWPRERVEATINFDDPVSKDMDLLRVHLAALKAGAAIACPRYSFAAHDRIAGETDPIAASEIVIVEGVHVLSLPSFHPLFDLKVYVDTCEDLRLARRVLRDIKPEPEGRGRAAEDVIAQYLRFVRASHRRFTEPAKYVCDIVLADEGLPAFAGSVPDAAATARLCAPVWEALKARGHAL